MKVLLMAFNHLCLVSPSSPSSPTTAPPSSLPSSTTTTPVLKWVSIWNVFAKTVLWRRVDALCFSLGPPSLLVSCNIKAYRRRFSFSRYSAFRGWSLAFHGHTLRLLEGRKNSVLNRLWIHINLWTPEKKSSHLSSGCHELVAGFQQQYRLARWNCNVISPHNQVWWKLFLLTLLRFNSC